MGVSVTRSDLLKGARFGQHEVVRLLGHGATASVFEGRHVALGKLVALKILHEHLAADLQVSARFVREGQIAAQLRHPNALDVIDVGVENGVPYLVMELLNGKDLRQHLADESPLAIDDALAILFPVASALAHAHEIGAIHRDLKPANVVLSQDARGDVVPKLVDFGLSKIVGAEDAIPLTATNIVVGTMQYMAPEQTLGGKHAGPRSDQYALAVILYECVVGHAPFEGEGFYALLEAIRSGVAKPPSTLEPSLPPALDAVVLRALAREPDRRFPSVRAFARELLPFASPETAAAWRRDFVDDASGPVVVKSRPRVAAPRATSPSSPSLVETGAGEASAIRPADPLPCAPGTSPFHIKGIAYRGIMRVVQTVVPGGLDAFSDTLDDPRLRDFVRQQFLATTRYDILPILPVTMTLARLLGQPFEAFVRTTSTSQARYDARTVFKLMWERAGIADLPKCIPRFGAQYYDFGKSRGSTEGRNHIFLGHDGVPAYLARWFVPMHEAYAEECGRIIGATDVVATARPVSPAGLSGGYAIVDVGSDVRYRAAVKKSGD